MDSENKVLQNGGEPDDVNLGGRRRNGFRKNSWLSHVKATMKVNRNKSFKQVLKIAKKSYKKARSQSQSQNAGKRRRLGNKRSGKSQKSRQSGGSGMAGKTPFGENALPVS